METAIKVVGMIGYLILCIAGAAFAVSLAFACAEKAFEKLIEIIRESERGRIANRMSQDSWWFSEDERTMLMLQDYAKNRIIGQRSVDEIRREWQNFVTLEKQKRITNHDL